MANHEYFTPGATAASIQQLGLAQATVLTTLPWWASDHRWKGGFVLLTRMTGIPERRLRRIIHKLESLSLVKVDRVPGQRNIYHLLDSVFDYLHESHQDRCTVCQAIAGTQDNQVVPPGQSGSTSPDKMSSHPGQSVRTDEVLLPEERELSSEATPATRPQKKTELRSSGEKKKKGKRLSMTTDPNDSSVVNPRDRDTWPKCHADDCDYVWIEFLNIDPLHSEINWEVDINEMSPYCIVHLAEQEVKTQKESKKVLRDQGNLRRCKAKGCRYFEEVKGAGFCRTHLGQIERTA